MPNIEKCRGPDTAYKPYTGDKPHKPPTLPKPISHHLLHSNNLTSLVLLEHAPALGLRPSNVIPLMITMSILYFLEVFVQMLAH